MKYRRLISIFAGAIFLAFGGAASAAIMYSIEGAAPAQIVDPLADAQTAPDYYDYPFEAASGNPDFGPVDDTVFFWLYTDTGTGDLSLGMIFDKRIADGLLPDGSTGNGGTMNLNTSGMPGTAFISDEDDPGDVTGGLIDGNETWGWNRFNTDGAVVSGLEDSTWIIEIDFNSWSGVDGGFFFLTGPSPTDPTAIAFDPEETLVIIAKVPEPTSLVLLALGLLGLGARRKFD
jgi:hypothetical protein